MQLHPSVVTTAVRRHTVEVVIGAFSQLCLAIDSLCTTIIDKNYQLPTAFIYGL